MGSPFLFGIFWIIYPKKCYGVSSSPGEGPSLTWDSFFFFPGIGFVESIVAQVAGA